MSDCAGENRFFVVKFPAECGHPQSRVGRERRGAKTMLGTQHDPASSAYNGPDH